MRFAFIILGDFDTTVDKASIHQETAQIIGVSSVEQACIVAEKLHTDGVDCIELCGAFGEDGANKIIAATKNEIPIGYVVHFEKQNELFEKLFG
ncbi:DUF6506 family protein [Candidatus Enterococcus ferrettii]|uniref:Uncharacterized protein n=1 Tax=Candidatus Enterococcus ferrettii TaxID=2815324 RepID=A0ABV0EVD6_9ENTE|nr:DUF6506 family protein [Enterococcus sp. 665A]MBO1338655.1 hypothetical protein [Enterococcus sp. 665A]